MLVGDGVVVGQCCLLTSGRACAVEIDDKACWMIEAGRDMHLIGALQSPERQRARDVSAGKRRCARTAEGNQTQKDSESRHAHDCVHDQHPPTKRWLPTIGIGGAVRSSARWLEVIKLVATEGLRGARTRVSIRRRT